MLLKRLKIEELNTINQDDYVVYEKYDGFRCLYENGKFYCRSNESWDKYFPEIHNELNLNYKGCVFDGELINSDGISKANILQQRLTTNKFMVGLMNGTYDKNIPATLPATYMIFDILEKDGISLRQKPLSERFEVLLNTINETDSVKVVKPINMPIKEVFDRITGIGKEGIVIKKKDSKYIETEGTKRTMNWIKVKKYNETILKVTDYEITNSGLVLLSDNHRITCNGGQSKGVKNEIDNKGHCFCKIGFLEQNEKTGMYRMPVFVGVEYE